jgi:hypothetical protein
MRRFRRNGDPLQRSDPADAKDLVDLAARMGIPPDDAMREVERLISDAGNGDWDDSRAPVAPRS